MDMPATPDRWKPTIWTTSIGGQRVVVKDVSHTAPLFRYTLGRLSLSREARIYRRLDGVVCVPRFLGRLDRDAILLEQVDAIPIHEFVGREHGIEPGFFDDLRACVDALHERGVLHMDLRHRGNILVDRDGRPRIVDFEIALYIGRNFLSRWLLQPLLAFVDRSAVLKSWTRYCPEHASEKDKRRYRRHRRLSRLWPLGRIWPLQRRTR